MTEEKDEVLTLSNPRLLSAIYFSLLAVIANQIIDTTLYAIGVQELLPAYKAIILAVIIAAAFGALFGERIVHCPKPYKWHVFWLGFIMVLAALPFHTLGFLWLFKGHHPHLFENATWGDLINMYLLVFFYSLILLGIWLAVFGGLAAIYLRHTLAYYLLRSLYVRRTSHHGEVVIKPKTVKHGATTVSADDEHH